MVTRRGCSALHLKVGSMPNDATGYLEYLQQIGALVHSAACPKMHAELQAAADRGAHSSTTAHKEFLWTEMYKICQQQHTKVLLLVIPLGQDGSHKRLWLLSWPTFRSLRPGLISIVVIAFWFLYARR